jgi:hypothetical protein
MESALNINTKALYKLQLEILRLFLQHKCNLIYKINLCNRKFSSKHLFFISVSIEVVNIPLTW